MTSVNKNSVISKNKTKSNTLNKTKIGNIKFILANTGVIRTKALLTVSIVELLGSAFGRIENILIKIVSIKSNILVIRYR
jgi:hypothetical protein